jgi:hypothetical protein
LNLIFSTVVPISFIVMGWDDEGHISSRDLQLQIVTTFCLICFVYYLITSIIPGVSRKIQLHFEKKAALARLEAKLLNSSDDIGVAGIHSDKTPDMECSVPTLETKRFRLKRPSLNGCEKKEIEELATDKSVLHGSGTNSQQYCEEAKSNRIRVPAFKLQPPPRRAIAADMPMTDVENSVNNSTERLEQRRQKVVVSAPTQERGSRAPDFNIQPPTTRPRQTMASDSDIIMRTPAEDRRKENNHRLDIRAQQDMEYAASLAKDLEKQHEKEKIKRIQVHTGIISHTANCLLPSAESLTVDQTLWTADSVYAYTIRRINVFVCTY